MQVVLEKVGLPEKGHVALDLQRSFDIQITSEEARKKVKRWLWTEVSMLLGTDTPVLIIDELITWRIPVTFSAPGHGRLGIVGAVDVLVQTGEMVNALTQKAALERCADEIAKRLPAFQPYLDAPITSIPTHIPKAPQVQPIEE